MKQGRCLKLGIEQTDKHVIFSGIIHYREKIQPQQKNKLSYEIKKTEIQK